MNEKQKEAFHDLILLLKDLVIRCDLAYFEKETFCNQLNCIWEEIEASEVKT